MKICRLDDIVPDTGVARWSAASRLPFFEIDKSMHTGERDPFSGRNVLSRGIVGD
jgi:hypothetical protein